MSTVQKRLINLLRAGGPGQGSGLVGQWGDLLIDSIKRPLISSRFLIFTLKYPLIFPKLCKNTKYCPLLSKPSLILEGYFRTGPGRWMAARIFPIWSSMELSRPEVVQHHGHLPICPMHMGLPMGQKTCQMWHRRGPDFAECIPPKPLDGFTPFKVLWNCLDLSCSIIVICLFALYGLAYG